VAGLELVLLLLAVSAALRVAAERLRVPYASMLVLGGLALAFVPGLPRVTFPPAALFLVFVPPLLYAGAVSFPLRELQRELGAIVRLAVVMVVVSTTAVALVAHALHPSFTWAAAIVLGVIVAPPDPVAVLSITRSLRAPRSVESILEGEGLVNDATALVIYRLAVAAAVTGTFTASRAAVELLLDGAGGVAVGLLVGWVVGEVNRYTRSIPGVPATVALLTPFAAFLLGERLGVSGVLAVLASGMYAARTVPRLLGPAARLQLGTMWMVVTFLLESLIFILVGLELPYVTRALERTPLRELLREAAIVSLCLIVVRLVWIVPSTYVFRTFGRWLGLNREPLPPLRHVLFVGWAGLRGGDSLVLALALPLQTASGAAFPARDRIVFITFCVILLTLLVQGPTLAPLVRRLGGRSDDVERAEEAHARLAVAEAGLRALDDPAIAHSPFPEVVRYLRRRHRQRARRWAARESAPSLAAAERLPHDHFVAAPSHAAGELDERRATEYRRIRAAMIRVEQERLLDLRDGGVIDDSVMRRVQRDLDLESLLLGTREPVTESLSEVPAAIETEGR